VHSFLHPACSFPHRTPILHTLHARPSRRRPRILSSLLPALPVFSVAHRRRPPPSCQHQGTSERCAAPAQAAPRGAGRGGTVRCRSGACGGGAAGVPALHGKVGDEVRQVDVRELWLALLGRRVAEHLRANKALTPARGRQRPAPRAPRPAPRAPAAGWAHARRATAKTLEPVSRMTCGRVRAVSVALASCCRAEPAASRGRGVRVCGYRVRDRVWDQGSGYMVRDGFWGQGSGAGAPSIGFGMGSEIRVQVRGPRGGGPHPQLLTWGAHRHIDKDLRLRAPPPPGLERPRLPRHAPLAPSAEWRGRGRGA